MVENSEYYKSLIKKHSGKSPILKNSLSAFFTGGLICFSGQWLFFLYSYLGVDEKNSYTLVTITFILLASLATAFGFFDKIARHGGAGTLLARIIFTVVALAGIWCISLLFRSREYDALEDS